MYAAIAAFNGGEDIDEYLVQSRRVLKVVGEYLHRRLTEMGAVVQKPEGAFYLFPDFSNCPRVVTFARKQEAAR